jgi:hypothetical protein
MPGDDVLPRAQYRCTRAITVAAAPEEVWPWLVPVGCLRAGWYANDLLDDLAHPSAEEIVPELRDLEVGRWLPMTPEPTQTTAFVVDSFRAPEWLLGRTPTSTWAWRRTARHGVLPPSHALTAPVSPSAMRTAMTVTGTRQASGGSKTATDGSRAPDARLRVRMGAERIVGGQLDGNLPGGRLGQPPCLVPEGVSNLDAAPISCAGVTTYRAVKVADREPTADGYLASSARTAIAPVTATRGGLVRGA